MPQIPESQWSSDVFHYLPNSNYLWELSELRFASHRLASWGQLQLSLRIRLADFTTTTVETVLEFSALHYFITSIRLIRNRRAPEMRIEGSIVNFNFGIILLIKLWVGTWKPKFSFQAQIMAGLISSWPQIYATVFLQNKQIIPVFNITTDCNGSGIKTWNV